MSIDKVDRMKDNVISNLSKSQLKQYIFHLSKKYYETYMKEKITNFNIQNSNVFPY